MKTARFLLILGLLIGSSAQSYVYNHSPIVPWTGSTIFMFFRLGNPGGTLIDGNTSYNAVANIACLMWNTNLLRIQFLGTVEATGPGGNIDASNQVFFAANIYGSAFPVGALAATLTTYLGNLPIESDVIVNTAFTWDSYRGNLQSSHDLLRVCIHEFGHILGLNHPDENGQTVKAIMNSTESNLDHIAPDDARGVKSLYGVPAFIAIEVR